MLLDRKIRNVLQIDLTSCYTFLVTALTFSAKSAGKACAVKARRWLAASFFCSQVESQPTLGAYTNHWALHLQNFQRA